MSNAVDMLVLLALGACVGVWMEFSAWRERAVRTTRALCQRYQLQLLDETVSLRRLYLRRTPGGLRIERHYDFEVSLHGNDRRSGQLWMIGHVVSNTILPQADEAPAETVAPAEGPPTRADNVVLLSSRRRDPLTRLH